MCACSTRGRARRWRRRAPSTRTRSQRRTRPRPSWRGCARRARHPRPSSTRRASCCSASTRWIRARASTTSCAAELARVEHAEALAVAANAAHEALAGEQGALDALGSAISALDGAARYDAKLGEFAESLREAGYVLEDMARETRDYREGVEFDPEALAQQQERMASLQGLAARVRPAHGGRARTPRRGGRARVARGRRRRARARGAAGARSGRGGACAGGGRAGRSARRGRAALRRGRVRADGPPGNGRRRSSCATLRRSSAASGRRRGRRRWSSCSAPAPGCRRARSRASRRAARSAASCWR